MSDDLKFKVPPQCMESEMSLLGSLILDETKIPDVWAVVKPNNFYTQKHSEIYIAILELNKNKVPVDMVTLIEYLDRKGKLDEVGGAAYLACLIEGVPTPENAVSYAKIVYEKYSYRQIISCSNEMIAKAYDQEATPIELVSALQGVYESTIDPSVEDVGRITNFEESLEWYKELDKSFGINTGFDEINEDTNGWQPGDLIVIMGRPETYKTFLALHSAYNAFLDGKTTLVIEVEMNRKKTKHRLEAFLVKVNSRRIRRKELNDEEFQAYMSLSDIMRGRKNEIYILTRKELPICTPSKIFSKVRSYNPDLVIVDSILSLDPDITSRSIRELVVSNVRSLKKIAEAAQVPIIAIHHTTRDKDKVVGKPSKDVAAESDVIAQDTDVLFHVQTNEDLVDRNLLFLGMAKNRDNEKRNYLLRCDMRVPEFHIERAGREVFDLENTTQTPEFAP